MFSFNQVCKKSKIQYLDEVSIEWWLQDEMRMSYLTSHHLPQQAQAFSTFNSPKASYSIQNKNLNSFPWTTMLCALHLHHQDGSLGHIGTWSLWNVWSKMGCAVKWKMPSRFQRGRKERRRDGGGRKENIFIHFWISLLQWLCVAMMCWIY